MSEELTLQEDSALDLKLHGSTGSFKVGTGLSGQNSLEVKYFLTHVGLDFSTGRDEQLLRHLAPVREIFNFEQLDFDEIMQRDIDDSRVSSELIPYILDEKSKDLIKLFPPIVVVVLPIKEQEVRPANKYPEVFKYEEKDTYTKLILRSGNVGSEVFKFEEPILNGKIIQHDKVRLHLNTNKSKLVIVDGQHRAMALLALYRNLKDQWSDEKRAPFKEYYSEWTPSYIQKYNLKEINLPIIFCTFPSLDEKYQGDFDLKQAARTIFLTLNKTARKVSNSRNRLLDDKDLIALFLRSTLSEIKRKDALSPYSLRIFNVELDQFDDKVKIQNSITLTGVNHIYYIIEHLMLNNEDINGVKPRTGKFFKRKDLNTYPCLSRLNGRDLLGAKIADSTSRDNFTSHAANILKEQFFTKYGHFIIKFFELFKPYEAHNRAVLELETRLETHHDRTLRPILFEGQGMSRVFENHRQKLKDKLNEGGFHSDVPKIQEIANRLDATAKRVENEIIAFKNYRSLEFLKSVSDKGKLRIDNEIHPKILTWINDLYDNVLTTVAFQTAVICGFYDELEKANTELKKNNEPIIETEESFNEFIDHLNKFFIPFSSKQFMRLVDIFTGSFEGDLIDWKIIKTPNTFRNVVYRGEMQPDQWPKYKYLILEIWAPQNEKLNEKVTAERNKCREQIFLSLYNTLKINYCQQNSILEENLKKDEIQKIFNNTYDNFSTFLKNIGGETMKKSQMKQLITMVPPISDEISNDEEIWTSVNGDES